jgi:RND family efflux transporter MFP subunit
MALWKQALLALFVLAAAVYGYAAFDAGLRTTLAGYGVPVVAFGGEGASAAETPRGRPGGGQGGGPNAGPNAGPVIVVAAPVMTAALGDRVNAIGTAEALRTVVVYSQSTGIVSEVAFQPGTRVETGDILVRLDDAAQKIARDQAALAVANAESRVARYTTLTATQAISSVQLSDAQAELDGARLALQVAELELERRMVIAPFAGIVGLADIDVGDLLSNSTAITTLDDRSVIEVEFRVPESYAAAVDVGLPVTATTAALPGEAVTGTVSALASRIEADSRTLLVRAALDNADDRLRPGMSFLVTLSFAGEERPSVPPLAVQWDREGSYVWRIDEGVVSRVGIDILERTMDFVIVDSDLAVGDQVVIEGVDRLRQGSAVALSEPSPAVEDAAAAGPDRG